MASRYGAEDVQERGEVKILTLLATSLLLSGCTLAVGENYLFASVGGDAKKVTASPTSTTIEGMNNSKGLKTAKELGEKVATMGAVKAAVGALPGTTRELGNVAEKLTN